MKPEARLVYEPYPDSKAFIVLYSPTQTHTPPKNTKITEYANHILYTVNIKSLYFALC